MFPWLLLYIIIYYVQPGGRWISLAPLRIELLVALIILIALILSKGQKLFKRHELNVTILFYFISITLSLIPSFLNGYIEQSFYFYQIIIRNFAIYIMIVGTIDSEKKLKTFIWVYIGIIVFYFTEPFMHSLKGEWFSDRGGVMHLETIGQFNHYNSLGGITVSNLPFLFQQFMYYSHPIIKLLLLVCMGIGMQVIMLTGSRTAYVGVVAFVCTVVFFSKRKLLTLLMGVVMSILIFVLMPDEYRARLMTLTGVTKAVVGGEYIDTFGARMLMNKSAFFLFLQNPLIGCGMDGFRHLTWHDQMVHNLYLQILTDGGLVQFVAFCMLVWHSFKYLLYVKKTLILGKRKKLYLYSIATAVQMFLIMRLVVGFFGMDAMENYWWIAAGLATVMRDIVLRTHAESVKKVA